MAIYDTPAENLIKSPGSRLRARNAGEAQDDRRHRSRRPPSRAEGVAEEAEEGPHGGGAGVRLPRQR